jgi:hypothetical protein
MSSLEVVRRPFAAFFEEALAPSWVAVELARPRADVVGTARLPAVDDVGAGAGLRLGLCVECLRPRGECICD